MWEARNASALNREVIAVRGLFSGHNLNDGRCHKDCPLTTPSEQEWLYIAGRIHFTPPCSGSASGGSGRRVGMGCGKFFLQDSIRVYPTVESNGFIESFHGKFRDELLNTEIFYSLQEVQVIIEQWQQVYNTVRPHSALDYRPPAPEAILAPVLAQPLCVVETSITT
jgi:hypothetical protein